MRFRACVLAFVFVSLPAAAFCQTTTADDLEAKATEAFSAGRTADAVALFEQLRRARKGSAPAVEARALWRLGTAYRGAGRTADAIRVTREAYRLATAAGDDAIAAETLAQLHQLNTYLPEHPDAPRALDEMQRLAERAAQPRALARAFDLRARWLADQAKLDDAIAASDAGIVHATAASDASLMVGLLAIRSVFTNRAGRLGEALADALRARDAAAKVGPRAEVTALFSLAQIHAHLSNFEESARLWTDVIDRYRAIGPPVGVALGLEARCHVWYELGRHDLVLADCQSAIDELTRLKHRPGTALYSRPGLSNIRLGRDTEARKWLAEASARLASAPNFEQIQTLTQIGMAYVMLGQPADAERTYARLLEMGRQRGSLEDEWKAQLGLGRAALVAHDPERAISHLEQAAELIERLRTTVPAQELRAAYLARRVEAHEWLVAALMMQAASPIDRHIEAAFNVAERARVRALADLLAEGRLKRGGARSEDAPRARTRHEIAANLGPRDLLLEYLVGEQHAYAWALTRNDLIGFTLPHPDAIETSVRQALAYIDHDDREGLKRIGEELTPALLGPALTRLEHFDRIIVVADGPLQRLPFAALPIPGRRQMYLAQRVATSSVGSGSLLGLLSRSESTGNRVLALATAASLREARGEAADAVRILGAGSAANATTGATELLVKQSGLADFRVIHVAAHSRIDEALPRNSAILLDPGGPEDGALRAAEIAQIPVRADLVVLAACRTQLGRVLRGEGLLSLARSFMEAGARSVVASLWDVGDRDTRVLMQGFYAGIAAGLAPDDALRIAQLQLMRAGGTLAAPKVWAAFQVSGEARQPVWPRRGSSTIAMLVALGAVAALILVVRR